MYDSVYYTKGGSVNNSAYYPAGAANDPRAPYNAPLEHPVSVGVECEFGLLWNGDVKTLNYVAEEWEDAELGRGADYYLAEDADAMEEYCNEYPTPETLLDNYSKLLKQLLKEGYFKDPAKQKQMKAEAYCAGCFKDMDI